MYHIVCPTKYRRVVLDKKVDEILKDICLEISDRYEIYFIEIGADRDHVHFLVQSVPMYSPTQITRIIKSITGREVFQRAPEVKKSCGVVNFGVGDFTSVRLESMEMKK